MSFQVPTWKWLHSLWGTLNDIPLFHFPPQPASRLTANNCVRLLLCIVCSFAGWHWTLSSLKTETEFHSFSFPHFFPALSSAWFLRWAGDSILTILTSLDLTGCLMQSKAMATRNRMDPPMNHESKVEFKQAQLSLPLKSCGGSGRATSFVTFAFCHIVILCLVSPSGRENLNENRLLRFSRLYPLIGELPKPFI